MEDAHQKQIRCCIVEMRKVDSAQQVVSTRPAVVQESAARLLRKMLSQFFEHRSRTPRSRLTTWVGKDGAVFVHQRLLMTRERGCRRRYSS